MHFLVSAIGSAGDVHPFIAISQALVARGHQVQLLASPHFAPRIGRAGIHFVPLGAPGDYERIVLRPELWHARRGTRLVLDELLRRLPEAVDVTAATTRPGETVLVGSTLSWNVRLVQELSGRPAATVHLSPLCLPSAQQPARLPGAPDLAGLPPWAVRTLQRLGERLLLDRWVAPRLNRIRAGLGLPPVRQVGSRWLHSPDLVLGAWPAWFAAAQGDWPAQARTTGFPLFTEGDAALAPALEAFVGAGTPPVGITAGSAMAHGQRFFAQAVRACQALGRRTLLITPYAEQLPAQLPPDAHHVAYAPFSALLPRLSALVHHGGIGTCAQALAAGLPQLVVPFAHDQFDNAARLRHLGVARTVGPTASVSQWVSALRELTDLPGSADAVHAGAARMAAERPAAQRIADHLEALAHGRQGDFGGLG